MSVLTQSVFSSLQKNNLCLHFETTVAQWFDHINSVNNDAEVFEEKKNISTGFLFNVRAQLSNVRMFENQI